MTTTTDAPLKRLLRQPLFRRWAVANLFARLPLTMNLLALVLVGQQVDGSLATGATLAGVATAANGLAAQWRGGQLDRADLRAGLRRHLLVSAAAVVVFLAAAAATVPVWLLAGLAAVLGVAQAALLGGFRTILVECVPKRDIEPANAIDAVFVEVAFIAGPAAAGALALAVGPLGVLAAMSAALVISSGMLVWLPTRQPADPGRRPRGPSPLRTVGATPVYLLVLTIGLPLGAWEASMPARLEAIGRDPATAGPFLALTAAGSALGGLVATNLRDPLRQGRLVGAALLFAWAVLYLPTGSTTTVLALSVALFAFGLPIAPLNALAGLAFQRTIATPRQAEGFSLYPAMILIGAGAGQFLAGQLLERISPNDLIQLLSVVPAALGVVLLVAAIRRRLRGLPAGVGYGHDPAVADPDGWAPPVR